MKSRIILFILAFIVWLMMGWRVDWQHLLVGFLASALVAYITGDFFTEHPHKFKQASRYFWFFNYIPVFLWEVVKGNVDLAYRVIHPNLPINPGIVRVKTKLKSETGLTFLANSITLKPGTTAVDIDQENGYIYVHWINVKTQETQKATEIIVKKLEDILERIYE